MGAPKGHPKYGGGIQKGDKHKKTIQKEKEIEFIQEKIRERLEPIIDALILKCEQNDLPAIKEALDRLIGKSKESMALDVKVKDYFYDDKQKRRIAGEIIGRRTDDKPDSE